MVHTGFIMMPSLDIYTSLCAYENLELAFKKARKHKTLKPYVVEFENNLTENLLALQQELLSNTYHPKPLKTFVIKDPKTRKISKSDFRDRVIHHALCNMIEPMFEKSFIYDSYANRKGKGTLKAIERFDYFKRKVSKDNTKSCYILKADIRHYFETVNHDVLVDIIRKRIANEQVIRLVKLILTNYGDSGKGMPLGNLTSQFFANVYLDKLDQFVKHGLKAKYYLRYVDDFIIMDNSRKRLQKFLELTSHFLKQSLKLDLHPDKTKIISLNQGVSFLGYRIFYHHKLLSKKNVARFRRRFAQIRLAYEEDRDYDKVYDFLEGWTAYAMNADTYNLRKNMLLPYTDYFSGEISSKQIDASNKVVG